MKLIQKMKCVVIAVVMFFLFYSGEYSFAGVKDLHSFYKADFKADDAVSKKLDPNVMILLDTSTAMTFSVNGVMPNANDGRTKEQRAELLKESTYGHGMRPPLFNGVETKRIKGGTDSTPGVSYSRYGRDLDDKNNVIGNSDCYYTSDPTKPFLLTFRNIHLAHRTDWIDSNGNLRAPTSSTLARTAIVGGTPTAAEIQEALNSWNKISQYVPAKYIKDDNGYWVPLGNLKACVPIDIANEHLVPNDSRLYKMKLALWRITEKTNGNILARMNLGVSITFQNLYRDPDNYAISVATKNAKPGAGLGERDYYGATNTFIHGNAAPYITGETQEYNLDKKGVSTSHAHMSQFTMRGVADFYNKRSPGNNMWNAISRSIMYVPFDKLYSINSSGNINQTAKLNDFRNYISGYENYKIAKDLGLEIRVVEKPIKDEFFASSLTLLSTAIYGGRVGDSGAYFPFHQGKRVSDPDTSLKATNELMIQFAVTPKTNAGTTNTNVIYLDPSQNTDGLPTGQAIGSVFDFFSPPSTNNSNGIDGVAFANNSIGFFPVTGSCQANWLIVFCAGNDAVPGYPPAEAIRRLFNKTLTMRGRRWNGSSWVEHNYEMDSGVRTIVVGFLPEEKTDEEPEIAKIRRDIHEMAQAGDPIFTPEGIYVDNPNAVPEIASDAAGLVKAFNNVLQRIHVDKLGSATVSIPPVIDNITDSDSRVVFGASYRINNLDQWTGWLGKYTLNGNTSLEQWEANRGMIKKRIDRELFTTDALDSVQKVNANILESMARIPENHSQKFSDWLLDYGYDPRIDNTMNSVGILGDMVNSGITVVGKPRSKSLINDAGVNNRDAVVYIQTNRGVLHALNYMNGNEIWGFIPPNVFQYKLKNMKIDSSNSWIDGNGFTRVKSNPMILLDGMLIARDVEYQNATKTLLTGYLGNGGNGFYTMDITRMDSSQKNPVFEWAIENARYGEGGQFSVGENIHRWGKAAKGNESDYDYTDLGLTIVHGVYFTPNIENNNNTIGVLPGGMGHLRGADSQGKVFYFFNPTDGSIRRKIDSNSNASTGFEAPNTRKLGMGISPIIYYENNQGKAIEFYTADSEGNILHCEMPGIPESDWKLKSIFQLRTLGSTSNYEPCEDVITASSADLAVAIPRKMILARSRNNYKWVFGGTSDIYIPNSNNTNGLSNKEQFIFGININNVLKSDEVNNPGISSLNENIRKLPYYADGIPSKYKYYGRPYEQNNDIGIKHGMTDYGWILRLRPKFGDTDTEYMSAEPYLMNNVLYIATFIPYNNTDSEEACSDIGVAKLYAIDPSTGRSVIPDKPAVMLENVKIAGITGNPSKDRLVLSLKELVTESANRGIFGNFTNPLDISSSNSLYEVNGFGKPDNTGGPEFEFEEMVPHVQYWRERF